MSQPSFPAFQDSLLDLLRDDDLPQPVQLASVHRPSFSQQLTVLREQLPHHLGGATPTGAHPPGLRKTGLRSLN